MTLIEIAIVLVILGLAAGLIVPLLSELTKHQHYRSTQKAMDEIKSALVGYANTNWRLPYADTTGDGVEDSGQLTGSIPYVTLGFGAVDSWRNRYFYDVNSRLVSTAKKANLCFALQSIASGEFPRVAFTAGGTQISQAIVFTSRGENLVLDGENNDGDRDYESYVPTNTFDDLTVPIDPDYIFQSLNCSVCCQCATHQIRNQRGSAINIQGGAYTTCTSVANGSTFTISTSQTINVYATAANCTAGTPIATTITYLAAAAADTNGNCLLDINSAFTVIDR